jgi:hypothetical protein
MWCQGPRGWDGRPAVRGCQGPSAAARSGCARILTPTRVRSVRPPRGPWRGGS